MFIIKIILGSKNKSKKEAIELALNMLNFSDFEIVSLAVDSHVSSKPINEEILIGAQNRNREVRNYCLENKIDYDLLISIEGGYLTNGYYYRSYFDSNESLVLFNLCKIVSKLI